MAKAKEPEEKKETALQTKGENVSYAAVRAQLNKNWQGVSDKEKVQYSVDMCRALGIPTPLNPFTFITMNGKEVLYATKEAAELLAKRHKISVNITNKYLDRDQNLYVVEVRASMPNGRTFDNLAAMSVAGKTGDHRANVMMKTVSKAIRRVVFSSVGLSILDQYDVQSMKNGATYETPPPIPPSPVSPAAILSESGIPADNQTQELADETIALRAEVLNTLCGPEGIFCGEVKKAKMWIQEKAGTPSEMLTADQCQELLMEIDGEKADKEQLPLVK